MSLHELGEQPKMGKKIGWQKNSGQKDLGDKHR
jgi:hypothetical protein